MFESRQTLVKDYTIMLAAILTGVMVLLLYFSCRKCIFSAKGACAGFRL